MMFTCHSAHRFTYYLTVTDKDRGRVLYLSCVTVVCSSFLFVKFGVNCYGVNNVVPALSNNSKNTPGKTKSPHTIINKF